MAVDVVMPQMGESIFEGTITKWLKKAGDKVERDEPLFEISTDKVDAEIPAPSAGVLKEIKFAEGQTVPVKTVVATIDSADGAAASAPAKAEAPAPPAAAAPAAPAKSAKVTPPPQKEDAVHLPAPERVAKPAAAPAPPSASAPVPEESEEEDSSADVSGNGHTVRSSPLVRRMARENNIDLSRVSGTGAGGRISKKDIQAAIESGSAKAGAPAAAKSAGATSSAPQAPPPATGGAPGRVALENAVPRERMYFGKYEVQPMSVMRQKIAEHMVASKRVSPHVYSIDEADMTKIASIARESKKCLRS